MDRFGRTTTQSQDDVICQVGITAAAICLITLTLHVEFWLVD